VEQNDVRTQVRGCYRKDKKVRADDPEKTKEK